MELKSEIGPSKEPSLHRPVRPALSGHQSSAMNSDVWLTPPEILRSLGSFDLDPCAPAVRPWDMAQTHISLPTDGLSETWIGRVWLNPPFGTKAAAWLKKMKAHGNGIALIPARTETAMFYESVWGGGDAVCFLKGRPHFHRADGSRAAFNSGAPICLVAYGPENVAALERAKLGVVVRWSNDSSSAMALCLALAVPSHGLCQVWDVRCSAWLGLWTPLTETMPELGQIVWLWDGNFIWIGGREIVDSEHWLWGKTYGSEWHNGEKWDGDIVSDDDYQPTHWMPLPNKPNKQLCDPDQIRA